MNGRTLINNINTNINIYINTYNNIYKGEYNVKRFRSTQKVKI